MAQAATNIAQVRALTTPAKQYLWEFIIPLVPAAAGAASENLAFRARSTVWPGRQITKAISHFKGHRIGHPGKNQFPMTMPVTFEEGMDASVLQAIIGWFNAWLNEKDGSSQGESAVKVDAIIRLLNHSQAVIAQGHMFGFYVENMSDNPLAYESEGLLNTPVQFGYDYWDLE